MMYVLIILLTLSVIGTLFILWKCMIDLNNRISELEKKIDNMQYQIDDVLHDINIMNENVLNTHGLLSEIEDKNKNDEKNGNELLYTTKDKG